MEKPYKDWEAYREELVQDRVFTMTGPGELYYPLFPANFAEALEQASEEELANVYQAFQTGPYTGGLTLQGLVVAYWERLARNYAERTTPCVEELKGQRINTPSAAPLVAE